MNQSRQAIHRHRLALRGLLFERFRTAHHVAVECVVLRGRSLRVRQSKQIAMAPAVALLVLQCLVSEPLDRLIVVPSCDRSTQTATPPAELLHVAGEMEKVRSDAAN